MNRSGLFIRATRAESLGQRRHLPSPGDHLSRLDSQRAHTETEYTYGNRASTTIIVDEPLTVLLLVWPWEMALMTKPIDEVTQELLSITLSLRMRSIGFAEQRSTWKMKEMDRLRKSLVSRSN